MDAQDLEKILNRVNVSGRGFKSDNATVLGGRLGYTQPIDDTSSLEVGASGHYAKGKGWKDTGIDQADLTYAKRFKDDSELRAKVRKNVGKGQGEEYIGAEYEIPFKKGGKVSKASKRADGIAQRGKTKGRIV